MFEDTKIVDSKNLKGNKAVRSLNLGITDCITWSKSGSMATIGSILASSQINKTVDECLDISYSGNAVLIIGNTNSIVPSFFRAPVKVSTEYVPVYNFYWPIYNADVQKGKEVEILNKFYDLLENKSSESALIYLFQEMISLRKDYKKSKDFLDYAMNFDLSVDASVHILNSLSPIKKRLANWDSFVEKCRNSFLHSVGEKETQLLLKVIL